MKLNRISMLMARQLKERAQLYVIGAAVLVGLLAFLFLIVHQWRDSFAGAVQNGVFLIGLFISGGLFTSTMFQELSESPKGIWLLGLPATQAEKVVAAILISAFAFLVVYVGIFYVVDGMYVFLTYRQYSNAPLDLFKNGFYEFLFTYLLFNAFILLGSVYFSKHSFIKTLLTLILSMVLLYYLNNFLMGAITGINSIVSSSPLGGVIFDYQGENIYIDLPQAGSVASAWFFHLLLPITLWSITWLRFTEKEI